MYRRGLLASLLGLPAAAKVIAKPEQKPEPKPIRFKVERVIGTDQSGYMGCYYVHISPVEFSPPDDPRYAGCKVFIKPAQT